jgi:hypothetical protein
MRNGSLVQCPISILPEVERFADSETGTGFTPRREAVRDPATSFALLTPLRMTVKGLARVVILRDTTLMQHPSCLELRARHACDRWRRSASFVLRVLRFGVKVEALGHQRGELQSSNRCSLMPGVWPGEVVYP